MVEQSINIGNLYRQADYKLIDSIEQKDLDIEHLEFFRKKGIIK